ncbi:CoA transferase [Halobaculum lipolyticum]|uniref:CoA transferase n=1 Tax=Halobaculum lipolyticum TaxID=3032001 RepID=A0ABD5WCF0_9EURY|nr:CoA transferase [Halobaculum sp. DT31]
MGSLDDLTVLDLTRVLGGPYCTMLLADMGADVVKVEPPGGDWIRRTPPFFDDEEEPYGGYFQSVNRGKSSVELDLTDEDDRADFLTLVDRADVLVENYRAGTMERFDLAYERLRERNPGLVYASIRGFGDPRTGATPEQDRPAYDLVVQAMAGVMQINGQPDDPPTKIGVGIGDLFTGVLSAVGILAAVHHRERTGEGQFVDTSMYDAMLSMCERAVYQYSYTGEVPGRVGNAHPILFPYDAFEARDGLVVVAAIGPTQWDALCRAIDRPDLIEYREQSVRLANRDALKAEITAWTSERTVEEVLDVLDTVVPCAPVHDVGDVFESGIADRRGMLVDLPHPGTDEEVTVAGSPIKMTETPTGPAGRAPLLDEHRAALFGSEAAERGTRAQTDGSGESAADRADGGCCDDGDDDAAGSGTATDPEERP